MVCVRLLEKIYISNSNWLCVFTLYLFTERKKLKSSVFLSMACSLATRPARVRKATCIGMWNHVPRSFWEQTALHCSFSCYFSGKWYGDVLIHTRRHHTIEDVQEFWKEVQTLPTNIPSFWQVWVANVCAYCVGFCAKQYQTREHRAVHGCLHDTSSPGHSHMVNHV